LLDAHQCPAFPQSLPRGNPPRLAAHIPRREAKDGSGERVADALAIHDERTETRMASSSKKKTTMKKLNRENAVRERQFRKQAKKNARKQAAADELARPSDTRSGEEA
jgi:hypothetical protein